MHRFVVAARLRRGAFEAVREILREGPPFDLAETSLERHHVFLARDEVIFVFEGPQADEEVGRLLGNAGVLGRAGRIAPYVTGPPRAPEELFSWERPPRLDGVSFDPRPGPGDSDGG